MFIAPYGNQKNLNHSISPSLFTKGGPRERALLNQTRKSLNIQHNQYGYTGQSQDSSTGLMMLGGFRNYAPGIGQFIQPDTYNSFSKTAINNDYAYVTNNPLSNVDLTGHSAIPTNILSSLSVIGSITAAFVAGPIFAPDAAFGIVSALGGYVSSDLPGANALDQKVKNISTYVSMGAGVLGSFGAIPAVMSEASMVTKSIGMAGVALGALTNALGLAAQATGNKNLAKISSDLGYVGYGLALISIGVDRVFNNNGGEDRIKTESEGKKAGAGNQPFVNHAGESSGKLGAISQEDKGLSGAIQRAINRNDEGGMKAYFQILEAKKATYPYSSQWIHVLQILTRPKAV